MCKKFCTTTVTRGESIKAISQSSKVLIDWLRCTFPKPNMTINALLLSLSDCMQSELRGIGTNQGLHGFSNSVRIEAIVNNSYVPIGFIAFDGASQLGRWMLELSGFGCGLVKDWYSLHGLLITLEARLTRIDLACDFIEGEKTVDDAVELFKKGAFITRGRAPSSRTVGDWIDRKKGRTIYIGDLKNGKELCIYEKGKQLGDIASPWVRYELRLASKDRNLPLDITLKPAAYYAGSYPVLQEILKHVKGERVDTFKKETEINLAQSAHYIKQNFGKTISALKTLEGFDKKEFVDAVTIEGLPKRLPPNYLDTALPWNQLKAVF